MPKRKKSPDLSYDRWLIEDYKLASHVVAAEKRWK
jgi:hypothetical protein